MKLSASFSDLAVCSAFLSGQPLIPAVKGCVFVAAIGFSLSPLQAAEPADQQGYYLDWVPYHQLTVEQRKSTRGMCEGLYVHPDIIDQPNHEITAREASYESDGKVILEGDVKAVTENGFLNAERATVSADRTQISASGHVVVRQSSGLIYGQSGVLNNNNKTFDLRQAEYLIFQNNARGVAQRLHRTDEGVVVIDNGSYTSCSPGDNSWQLVGSEIELDHESGFGTASHARLELADVPVFYWPYLRFPIDDRRHTGLLMPAFSVGGEGVEEYKQSLYLNLAPNYDATLTPHWYQERGTHLGTEWRYLFPENHYGMITYDFLESDPLYEDKKRELFAYEAKGYLADNWMYRIDYAHASDDDYFHAFEANFDDANTEALDQLAETQYRQGNWHYIARLQGFQELDSDLADADREYYKLPELQANYASGSGALSYGSRNQAVWFERDILDDSGYSGSVNQDTGEVIWGSDLTAQRTHLEPYLSYRADALWGYSQLDLRGGYSQYALKGQPDDISGRQQRFIPTFALDSGLLFERDMDTFGKGYIQTLEPRIKLVYAPTEDQHDIPLFDTSEYEFDRNQLFRDTRFSGVDRQGDLQKLALGVTTRFIDDASGREVLNLSLGQAFYAQERTVTLSTNPQYEPDYQHTRLVSPLVAAVSYYPLDWLTLDVSTQWNTDNTLFFLEKRESKVIGNHPSGVSFLLRHTKSYTGCSLNFSCAEGSGESYEETADFGLIAPLSTNWKAFGVIRRDIEQGRHLERIAGIEYESCCWSVRLARHQYYNGDDYDDPEAFDNSVRIELLLKGFGGIGQGEPYERAAGFIPGFRAGY